MAKQTQSRRAPPPPPPRRPAAPPPKPQTREQQTRAVATLPKQSALPDYMREKLVEDAGAGLSTDMADNLTPLIYILQPMSPQAMERDPAFIDGAKAGSIWLRNAGDAQLQDGEEGIFFQPCHFNKCWIEWKPNRGGFVRRHAELPEEAEQKALDMQRPDRLSWVMPNGNVVVETREHSGIVHLGDERLPYTIPFSSTGHTVSRGWMTTMNRKIVQGQKIPSYGFLYRLTTDFRQNDDGSWYVFKVDDIGYIETVEDYEMGKALNLAFESGERRAADDVVEDGAIDNSGGGVQSRAERAGL